jgi:hypothetical protein
MDRGRSSLGLALVLVGAAVMVNSTFLPFNEPVGAFGRVSQNTMIQDGNWWSVIATAALIAFGGYRAARRNGAGWVVPIIFCVIAGAIVIFLGSDKDERTLHPVNNATADTSVPLVVTNLGIAIYVTGLGVALAFIGGMLIKPSKSDTGVSNAPPAKPKQTEGIRAGQRHIRTPRRYSRLRHDLKCYFAPPDLERVSRSRARHAARATAPGTQLRSCDRQHLDAGFL